MAMHTMRKDTQTQYLLKNCIFTLTYLNFSNLQSTIHLMPYTYQDSFSPLLKLVFYSSYFMLFSASAVFCFTSSTSAKCFPLRTFFIQRNKKKLLRARCGRIGKVEHGGHDILVNNCWPLSTVRAGAPVNHPSWNGQMRWVFKKQFNEAKRSLSQQCPLVHWYRGIPRTLTYHGKPGPQGTCPPEDNYIFGGYPCIFFSTLILTWCLLNVLIFILFHDQCCSKNLSF